MSNFDINAVVSTIKSSAAVALGKDLAQLASYKESELQSLATQAQTIATQIAQGQLSQADQTYFLGQLKEQADVFAHELTELAAIEAAKVWNAVVDSLWSAINATTGLALPIPS